MEWDSNWRDVSLTNTFTPTQMRDLYYNMTLIRYKLIDDRYTVSSLSEISIASDNYDKTLSQIKSQYDNMETDLDKIAEDKEDNIEKREKKEKTRGLQTELSATQTKKRKAVCR